MTRSLLPMLCITALLPALTACKIVKTPDPTAEGAVSAESQTDEARMAQRAAEIFAPELVPYVTARATDIAALREALAAGPDAAGATHGIRPQSEGSPWNFIAKGQGTVVGADLKSRAARMDLDTDGDGAGDVTVQLGPIMKGTSLRDAADFLVFTDFRDQIEFAKLARALNDAAHKAIPRPEADPTGKTYAFEGVFTIRSKGEPILLVPTQLTEVP